MIKFLKHENALSTVNLFMTGKTDIFGAYNAQCMFLNNNVSKEERVLEQMYSKLERLTLERDALDIYENTSLAFNTLTITIYDLQIAIINIEESNNYFIGDPL